MHKRLMNGTEPAVDQGVHYGWCASWNPDDGKYYIEIPGGRAKVFTEWRNAVQWARRNRQDSAE